MRSWSAPREAVLAPGLGAMTSWQDDAALDRLEQDIDGWLAGFRAGNPVVAAVDRGEPADAERRWYVRMRGEEKDFITVWLTLGQRTLRYEAYVMPAPEENAAELYEQLLRRNERLVGAHFAIGVEDAIFLRGELPNLALNEAELDRIIGSLYACVEQSFPAMIRLGFASRFRNTGGDTEGDASADRGGDAAG